MTHLSVRGTHSLMRFVTCAAVDAGAPETCNAGGRESCMSGNGDGPATAKSQGTWNAVKERGNENWQPDMQRATVWMRGSKRRGDGLQQELPEHIEPILPKLQGPKGTILDIYSFHC